MTHQRTAAFWVDALALAPHPEGGFYRETYRATCTIPQNVLSAGFEGDRTFSTSIYYLLRSEDRSVFHRIKSDELWHFYAGSALDIFVLDDRGLTTLRLGDNPDNGESLQVIVPANTWFGARVATPETYTLAGCTVSPGFDYRDFEIADRALLLESFPTHREIIELLT